MSLKNFMRQKKEFFCTRNSTALAAAFFYTTIITTTFEQAHLPTHCHFYSEFATTRTPARHHGVSLNIQQIAIIYTRWGITFCGRCDGGGGYDRRPRFLFCIDVNPADMAIFAGCLTRIKYCNMAHRGKFCMKQRHMGDDIVFGKNSNYYCDMSRKYSFSLDGPCKTTFLLMK